MEETSGFFINLRKLAERPEDPCFVWDYEQEHYVWDHLQPGCGPVGGDGGEGGADGGGPPLFP